MDTALALAPTLAPTLATDPAPRFRFDNSYARLPEPFHVRLPPVPVEAPKLVRLNRALAERLGLDAEALASPAGVEILAGNRIAEGSEPITQAYAGHQFGHFNPKLGDGRAHLLGEVIAPDGARFDMQLKGSGRTPWSRGGDGRAAIGPMLREYIISEALHALGIPTTRSLSVVTTGEHVFRETALPGAVLARVASSHIRVGTFQYFAARGDMDSVRRLLDHAIARHDPAAAEAPVPALAFLRGVIARQADLIAQWLLVGFVHGVMNTDNMTVSGESIDFGPCAFMEAYDPGMVLSSIDHQGRYAYGNQPRIAHWNLTRLAEALLPLLAEEEAAAIEIAKEALGAFALRFGAAYGTGLLRKIGIEAERDGDAEMVQDLLRRMAAGGADFTLAFRHLADAADGNDAPARALFADPAAFDAWAGPWRARLAEEVPGAAARMRAANPLYIPRNHLVEEALAAATERADYAPFEALLEVLARPFERQPGRDRHAAPAQPEERVAATFCGT